MNNSTPSASRLIKRRRANHDKVVKWTVTVSGMLILLTLATLIWHLLAQVLPLFAKPDITPQQRWQVPANYTLLQINDLLQGQVLLVRDDNCQLDFLTLEQDDTDLKVVKSLPGLCEDSLKAVKYRGASYLARLSKAGMLRIERIVQSNDLLEHRPELTLALNGPPGSGPVLDWQLEMSSRYLLVAARFTTGWWVYWVDRRDSAKIQMHSVGVAQQLLLLPEIEQLMAVKGDELLFYDRQNLLLKRITNTAKVTFARAFPQHRSLLLGQGNGQLFKWSASNHQGTLLFSPVHQVQASQGVRMALFDADDNGMVLFTEQAELQLVNRVTGQRVMDVQLPQSYQQQFWQGRRLYTYADNELTVWQFENLSAITSMRALWGRIRYEGYEKPEYIWQTTPAADYQDAKFSLVPLIVGSLKVAFLALIISAPLAISAAIYTAFFAPNSLRAWLKPSIEMLEAIPSVIIAFVAALWLMPMAESFLFALALMVILIPLFMLLFALLQPRLISLLPKALRREWEVPLVSVFLIALIFLLIEFAPRLLQHIMLMPWFESWPLWRSEGADKSTLVAALALGIAITPSIYSLAEDAIFEVPEALKQASFALGATHLQTLRNVVLVIAYPGLLSAMTLGFGRAFGETMIVLMVTGNTPLSDWDPLAGLRALTANLTIELPEAAVASSHYRILFLSATVLFIFTFFINTLAELLRRRLRKNYPYG